MKQYRIRWTDLVHVFAIGVLFGMAALALKMSHYALALVLCVLIAQVVFTWVGFRKGILMATLKNVLLVHYTFPTVQVGVVLVRISAYRCGSCHEDFHMDREPSCCPMCSQWFFVTRPMVWDPPPTAQDKKVSEVVSIRKAEGR